MSQIFPRQTLSLFLWCVLIPSTIVVGQSTAEPLAVDDLAVNRFVEQLQQLGPEGFNHPKLIQAAAELKNATAKQGLQLLKAMDDQRPLQANWLRLTAESIFQQHPPELSELRNVITSDAQSAFARIAAFDLLDEMDSVQANALVPSFRLDPCLPLRRISIQQSLEEIDSSALPENDKQSQMRLLLNDARDIDQVDQILKSLKESEDPINRNDWLGFLLSWKVIGPFDNSGGKGFAAVYPIEQRTESPQFNRTWPGKEGTVAWKEIQSTDKDGFVDINTLLAKHNGAVVYLATNFQSNENQPAQIRLGTYNAMKAWVNGVQVLERNVYHTNEIVDQFVADVQLQKGDNWIVLKLCQNEQKESWAQNWRFLCRMTDSSGKALPNLASNKDPN